MKKGIITLILAAMVLGLSAAPVSAKDRDDEDRGREKAGFGLGKIAGWLKNDNSSAFVVTGTIQSVGANSFVVAANHTVHVENITNGLVTVKVDSNTKFKGTDNSSSISSTSVGKNVVAVGKTNTGLLATHVTIVGSKQEQPAKKGKAMGEVTSKTDTSITIKNSLTGDTKTIATNSDTAVRINGEAKTLADVKVGDSGWVKFKTVGSTLVAKIINLFR